MKKNSKLVELLQFDLHALEHGTAQLESEMIQLSFLDRSYNSYKRIIGVDEVGRGCLAGPVMAGAVSFDLSNLTDYQKEALDRLDDSKKLTPRAREKLCIAIRASSHFAIGHVSNEDVDRFNILNASMIAMEKAVSRLLEKLKCSGITEQELLILVDGKKPLPAINSAQLPVTKGDGKSASIAAASIVAKVTRDKLMRRYNRTYPHYYWDKNKGYPSKLHVEALKKFGPTPIHRLSFGWR